MNTYYCFPAREHHALRSENSYRPEMSRGFARAILFGLLLFASGGAVDAADLVFSLVPPTGRVIPGQLAHVDILAVNPSAVELPFDAIKTYPGKISTDKANWDIAFQMDHVGAALVQPGAFATRSYGFMVPSDAVGRAVLEISLDGTSTLRTVIDIGTVAEKADQTSNPPASLGVSTFAVDAAANRMFAGRLSPNEPVYFIYGNGKHSAAKFQFSFNYRLGSFRWADQSVSRIQMGYTQRSLWDTGASSSPFYDTSYMPEISIDKMAHLPETSDSWLTWIGMMGGLKHESNGRDGPDSRGLNTIYARVAFAIGSLDSWHLIVAPEVFTYYTFGNNDLSDNKDIKDYRGYGRFRAIFGKTNGPSLLASVWSGEKLDHVSYQLDLSYPLRTHFLKIESFLLLQYFNGYGESLKDYKKKSDALRIGIELVR